MALGKIGGKLLSPNLVRDGVDLTVRNDRLDPDILYIDVNTNRLGINTDAPVFDLDVRTQINTVNLDITNTGTIGNIVVDEQGFFTTTVGPINIVPTQNNPEITLEQIRSDDLYISDNIIGSYNSNSSIDIEASGSGTINLEANTNVTGNLFTAGNISLDGNLSTIKNLVIGDQEIDTVTINPPLEEKLEPGLDNVYDLGRQAEDSSPRRWSEVYVSNISTVDNYFPDRATVSNQLLIDGITREITTLQSNDNVVLKPRTGLQSGELLFTFENPNTVDTPQDDNFGFAVDISQTKIAISAPNENITGGSNSGKVYVYDAEDNTLFYSIENPNAYSTPQDDQFGYSLSLSDSYLAIGAPFEDDASGNSSGKAYIYNANTGVLLHSLDNPNILSPASNDNFGEVVASTETYTAVAAPGEQGSRTLTNTFSSTFGDTSAGTGSFTFNVDSIVGGTAHSVTIDSVDVRGDLSLDTEFINLKLSTESTFDTYQGTQDSDDFENYTWLGGNPTLSSGSFVIDYDVPSTVDFSPIGMPDNFVWQVRINMTINFTTVGSNSGAVYLYENATGSLVHSFVNPNTFGNVVDDDFGKSIGLSETHLIVGTPGERDNGGNESGKVYVYENLSGSLLYTIDNPTVFGPSAGDRFGASVDINDDYFIVGAPKEDDIDFSNAGAAYIYNLSTGTIVHTLENSNGYGFNTDDEFGSVVKLNDEYALVAGYLEDDAGGLQSGKVYFYRISDAELRHTLNNPNVKLSSAGDQFGRSIGMSEFYSIIGAPFEDSSQGNNSGAAYKYWNIATLVEVDDTTFSSFDKTKSEIINNFNSPLTFAQTGIGYLRFTDTNAIVIPAGDNSTRPSRPELGDTRWNTEKNILEVFAGQVEEFVLVSGNISGLVDQTIENVAGVTNNSGENARIDLQILGGVFTFSVNNPGRGYIIGDSFVVSGNTFAGGASPTNDITFLIGAQTDDGYLISTGGGEEVTETLMEDLGNEYALILG